MVDCNPHYKHAVWSLYRYEPSLARAIIFCVLFRITTCLHAYQMYRTRTWYLSALVIGAICNSGASEIQSIYFPSGAILLNGTAVPAGESVGYITRAIRNRRSWLLEPLALQGYVVQNVLILIAPAFMAASIYMILGRIILLTDGESHSLSRRRWITKIFVAGDVASLLLQASGENIIVVGLFVQLAFFGFFVIASSIFHKRMSLKPTAMASEPAVRWKHYTLTLYVTSGLILVRSIFRVIEYLMGNGSVLIRSEVYLYVFDALLMITVLVWMNWIHPSELGVLLRGQSPGKNGLELVGVRI